MNRLDRLMMTRALVLAERGRGLTSPNPVVGACVVKNNKVISEGYHQAYGAPHAEVIALKKAGKKAQGATLYLTLEPCSSWGKTPPCVQMIIRSGVKKVVIAALDPNPKHHGRGIRILKKAGIAVKVGVLRQESEKQNRAFRKWITTKKPYVTLKLAESLDGKIATRTGDSKWITSPPARKFAHQLRASADAVLVGKNTVLRDNPKLTVRLGDSPQKGGLSPRRLRQPWKVVLDANAEISKNANIFRGDSTTVLICALNKFKFAAKKFASKRVAILPAALGRNDKLDLRPALEKLGKLGVTSILVEGGGEVAASFLEKKLADEIHFVIAPKIVGGRSAKTSIEGEGVAKVHSAVQLRNRQVRQLGDDVIISGELS